MTRWTPGPDWRLGFGARCSGNHCSSPENAQWVDNLVIISDALLETDTLLLALSLNGQQYLDDAPFTYNAIWSVTAVAPSLGPAAGGTRLTVSVSNLDGGAASEYSCRFGSDSIGWLISPATQAEWAVCVVS